MLLILREIGNKGVSGQSESEFRNLEAILCYIISLFCSEQLNSKNSEINNVRSSIPVTRIYVAEVIEWQKHKKRSIVCSYTDI